MDRFSGGGLGAVRGLSAVERVISGNCLLTSAARSSPSAGILEGMKLETYYVLNKAPGYFPSL